MSSSRDKQIPTAEDIVGSKFGVDNCNVSALAADARDFAVYKGLLKRTENQKYAPFGFCLLPSAFPKKWFAYMKKIQPVMNHVIHRVAHSPEFLKSCLENAIETDDFTAKTWQLYETVLTEGIRQPFSLGLLRCDYMLDGKSSGGLKQIENNTFAVAFSNMAPLATDIHRFVLDRLKMEDELQKLPENNVMMGFAKAMVSAWTHYNRESAVILFVVADTHITNICDQRALEFIMWELNNKIKVLRCTFSELHSTATLEDGNLFVDGQEIAIVYYRWGYSPDHYEEEDWSLRLMMERSMAIKCPSAAYHLAGMKRVQYCLTLPGILEKFIPVGVDPELIRKVFAEQHVLDMTEEGEKAVSIGISDPHNFVLKPEREGGGNNIYGDEIREMLKSIMHEPSRQNYILMEKINPTPIPNFIVPNAGQPKLTEITTEIGIYGVLTGTEHQIHQNIETGFVVKTKETDMNEGGLCSCVGSLGSLYLV